MNVINTALTIAMSAIVTTTLNADTSQAKRTLQNNMTEIYNTLPSTASTFGEVFSKSMFYGRLRSNYFQWDWKKRSLDNRGFGLGGSLIYKTAPLYGLSTTVGLYTSSSPIPLLRVDTNQVAFVKAGKDTFSRYNVANGKGWNMFCAAQAYLQYDKAKSNIKLGRQIFESFLTKSNDTKMIPNTFEGASVEINELPQTRIRGAYFYAQKLRDHTTFHDVITFNNGSGNPYSFWNNNDDSAGHRGLSYNNFKTAGKSTHHSLIVSDLRNKSIKNLQIDMTYGAVPDVVSSVTGELNYKINLPEGFSLTPGMRYMYQMDDGGGKIGGATLKGTLAIDRSPATNLGYKKRYSLDSSLWMARLVLKKGALKAKLAYSAVADEADIVAPWRGFPTGGYTRAMGQYNWYANTKTTAFEVNYDFSKANLISGFSSLIRYVMQDFDEAKQVAGVQADTNILQIDLRENFTSDFYAKVRIGLADADKISSGILQGRDVNSYNEYRFELNYLF